jgi:hypothetical protein
MRKECSLHSRKVLFHMARLLPRLDRSFSNEVTRLLDLAEGGENVRSRAQPRALIQQYWYPARIESLYELVYLKIWIEWEFFLEESLLRYMCGYNSRYGVMARVGGLPHYPTIAAAQAALLGAHHHLLWHSPTAVVNRARGHLVNSQHELVLNAAQVIVGHCAAVRHHVAHGQENTRIPFDNATMHFVGRRYSGARVGLFLRDWNTTAVPEVRWIHYLASQLANLASLIV